jgi:hypothetical protein
MMSSSLLDDGESPSFFLFSFLFFSSLVSYSYFFIRGDEILGWVPQNVPNALFVQITFGSQPQNKRLSMNCSRPSSNMERSQDDKISTQLH